VVKVKIYDLNGLTVYSSDASQIGENKLANPATCARATAIPASNLTYRESFDAWEGQLCRAPHPRDLCPGARL
jgi:hypothetical protein